MEVLLPAEQTIIESTGWMSLKSGASTSSLNIESPLVVLHLGLLLSGRAPPQYL